MRVTHRVQLKVPRRIQVNIIYLNLIITMSTIQDSVPKHKNNNKYNNSTLNSVHSRNQYINKEHNLRFTHRINIIIKNIISDSLMKPSHSPEPYTYMINVL